MQNFGLLFQLIVLKLETLISLIACVMREYTKMEICVLYGSSFLIYSKCSSISKL